jgi:hypothetical protein
MKNQKIGLLAILAVVIVVVAVSGCNDNTKTNGTTVNAISENGTKLAIYNNGSTWAHIELDANATHKNGTNITFGADTFVKPNDNVTIDISQILGYENQSLPAGTVIRVQSWKGLFNTTSGGTDTLKISFQGWSNTRYPTASANLTNVTYSPLNVSTLPVNITSSIVYLGTTPAEIANIQSIDTSDEEPLYEEEIITVNADGSVTIVVSKAPELCRAIASII